MQNTNETLFRPAVTVGAFTVTFATNTKLIIVKPTPGRWPDDLRPTLYGGLRADHLTIPLEPRNNPPHKGKICIHLTYINPDGSKEHLPLCPVDPAEIAAWGMRIEQELLSLMLRLVRPVTGRGLRRQGCVLMVSTGALEAKMEAFSEKKRPHYRFCEEDLNTLTDGVGILEAQILDHVTPTDLPSPIQVVHVDQRGRPELRDMLLHLPLPSKVGPAGWYAFSVKAIREFSLTWAREVAGAADGLIRTFLIETQADIGDEAIRDIIRKG